MHLTRAVRGQHDDGRGFGGDGAEFWDRDLEIRERLQQESLEGFIGAVDLVDEQDGRAFRMRLQRLQEGALDQERLGKKL